MYNGQSSSSSLTDQRVINATEESEILERTLLGLENEQLRNTTLVYKKKQEIFMDFCIENRYEDGCIVTEAKLLRFLDEVVVPRGNLKKGQKDNSSVHELKMETIQQCIKAVVNLHAIQFSRNMFREVSVRGVALRAWLKNRRHSERQRKRESYEDRARHNAQNGYTPEELVKLSIFYFKEGKEKSFRDRMLFLMQHMMLLRGESTRDMELCDLFPLEFKGEGFSECPVLVLRRGHEKTVKERIQYAGTIRHRDHRVCAFGALTMCLFYRRVDWMPAIRLYSTN
ncbi:hypothetical protein RMCBS344292_18725 [Rhizopus microsporus]|nr:hypothetical protein RMCBS344292_18725 [Rhizopus microsporus]